MFVVALRRNELERRARVRRAAAIARAEQREREERDREEERARRARAERAAPASPVQLAPVGTVPATATDEGAQPTVRPGEWVPRPVPLPTYALRGEVDDLGSRHAAHRASLPGARVPLEREDVEVLEAADETFAPAADIDLDAVLARRRA